MFRLLGMHPGPDVSLPAAASLGAVSVEQARKLLDELARAYLVEEHLPGRFTFHDLLRTYAAEQAEAHESRDELTLSVRRLLDHYLRSVHDAGTVLHHTRLQVEMPPAVPGVLAEAFRTYDQAKAWERAERQVIQKLVAHAAERGGFDAYCWQIPRAIAPLLMRGGHWHDYLAGQRIALAAARNLGNPLALGHAHYEFGHACALMGDVVESHTHLEKAMELFTRLGDRAAEAMAQDARAQLLEQQGKYIQALESGNKALRLHRELGGPIAVAHCEQTVGSICARLGQYDVALRHCSRALELSSEAGTRLLTADTLATIGHVRLGLGDYEEAIACCLEALGIYNDFGDANVAPVLTCLGDAQLAVGNPAAAHDSWQQALTALGRLPHADDQPVKARLAKLR
jgi:tetratricopeptide (TPR) repeat protein